MNTTDELIRQRDILKVAAKDRRWGQFGVYCKLREQGLRKQALQHLNDFVTSSLKWDFEKQRAFVRWLGSISDASPAARVLLPEPLLHKLIAPVLEEWLEQDSSSDEALALRGRILGDIVSYNRAIALNPNNQIACRDLAINTITELRHATSDIPVKMERSGQELHMFAEVANEYIDRLTTKSDRKKLAQELKSLTILIQDWIDFGNEGGTDFGAWCALKNRRYTWANEARNSSNPKLMLALLGQAPPSIIERIIFAFTIPIALAIPIGIASSFYSSRLFGFKIPDLLRAMLGSQLGGVAAALFAVGFSLACFKWASDAFKVVLGQSNMKRFLSQSR